MSTTKVQSDMVDIDGATTATIATGDKINFLDITDSLVKEDTVQGILDLAGGGFTLGTPITTTSGTTHTFGSIPAGVTMIVMNIFGWSQGSAGQIIKVTLGDAGGLETAGYLSCGMGITDQAITGLTTRRTDSFHFGDGGNFDAAELAHGNIVFALENSSAFSWTASGQFSMSNADILFYGAGSKSLSGELTQISITGGGTSDAGEINIMYQ
jgi:hypothetical protein